uniref:ORF92 n=1 Tax=Saccharolobus islandicus TaxID=43080 RepID=Q9C4W6_SACIS|nr:hypothetical protein [Sulfolobus islandicus]AAK06926.1 ORF92 [Sulfolobus islandicus]
MTVDEIIEENRELHILYARAMENITKLQNKIMRLQKENEELKKENEKLRKQRNILLRGMEIALQISNREKADLHLRMIIERIKRETGELKGD